MAPQRFTALVAAAGLCLLPACGSDDDDASDGGSSESAKPASVTFETTDPSRGKVSIETPKTIEAGVVELTLKNSGKGPHDAQLVRVDGDQTAKEVIENVTEAGEGAGTPDWAHGGGGVGTVPPGRSASVTEVLEPGTYYVVDTEGSGGGNRPSNSKRGGIERFEVTGEADGELPSTDAKITADEYQFESEGVKPGRNRLTFANAGEELHHIIALPLNKGATIEEAKEVFAAEEEPEGPPPVDFERFQGTAVIDGGEEQIAELRFDKGRYALVCFISNRSGGPSHAELGMVSELDVK